MILAEREYGTFAIVGDLHFGAPDADVERANRLINDLRSQGIPIVFNGDLHDIVRNEYAVKEHPITLQKGDIYIIGNHDWMTPYNFAHHALVTSNGMRFFITHGDQLDFWTVFAWMEAGVAPFPLSLIQRLRRWRIDDVFLFYHMLEDLPDWVIRNLEHGKGYNRFLSALALIAGILRVTLSKREYQYEGVYSIPEAGALVALDSELIISRLRQMFPVDAVLMADYIVTGHLHKTMFGSLNGQYHLGHGAFVPWADGRFDCSYILVENGKPTIKLV